MNKIKFIILPLSFFCLFVSCAFFIFYFADNYLNEKDKLELIDKKEYITSAAISPVSDSDHTKILSQYEVLYKENPDLIGWIKIEDTPIDYPVM
ncbi:MAG: hypothetical protein AAGU75_16010, partial [Bacillota bacterium]